MASPVRAKNHGEPHAAIVGWLLVYKAATPGAGLADNTTVRLDATTNHNRIPYCGLNPKLEGNLIRQLDAGISSVAIGITLSRTSGIYGAFAAQLG